MTFIIPGRKFELKHCLCIDLFPPGGGGISQEPTLYGYHRGRDDSPSSEGSLKEVKHTPNP